MPKKLRPVADQYKLKDWILARDRFHTGELMGLLHGFPGAPFRDSEVARRTYEMVVGWLVKSGKIVKVGERWSDTIYERKNA